MSCTNLRIIVSPVLYHVSALCPNSVVSVAHDAEKDTPITEEKGQDKDPINHIQQDKHPYSKSRFVSVLFHVGQEYKQNAVVRDQ